MPRKLAADDNVAHLVWLKYNDYVWEKWTSVYNSVFSKVIENKPYNPIDELSTGTLIKIMPPISNNCRWNYREIYHGNSVLVLEIIATTGFNIPFKSINYFHQSFDKVKIIGKSGMIRRTKSGQEDTYVLSGDKPGDGTRNSNNQSVIELSPTEFVHDGIINIKRLKGKEIEAENGVKLVKTKTDLGAKDIGNEEIAST